MQGHWNIFENTGKWPPVKKQPFATAHSFVLLHEKQCMITILIMINLHFSILFSNELLYSIK